MNEKDRFEPKTERKDPEQARVYAPTHPGLRGMNLRPFKGGAQDEAAVGEAGEEKEEALQSGVSEDAAGESAYEDITPSEETEEAETEAAEEAEEISLFDDPEDTEEDERPITVAEAKRRDRRLTEREKRRRAHKRKMMRLIGRAVFFTVFAAMLLLVYFLLIIDNIEVYGMERFTQEEILAASGLEVGQHMWLAKIGSAKEAIEEDPYIASVEITRIYPNRLVLRVTERTERAVILGMNTHAVIDGEGYVLSLGTRASYEGLLEVYGTGAGSYHVNQKLGEESDFHSRTLVTLLRALEEEELLDTVKTLDISNPLRITMVTFDGLTVIFGQADNAAEKLMNFRTVLPLLIQRGYDSSGTLDLSAKGSPVYSPPDQAPAVPLVPESTAPEGTEDPNAEGGTQGGGETPESGTAPAVQETPVPETSVPPEDGFSG